MIVADISETKARLSSFVAAVQAGDEVIITERGRSVARIVKEPNQSTSESERLASLVAAGLVTLPAKSPNTESGKLARFAGTRLSDIVSEDRR